MLCARFSFCPCPGCTPALWRVACAWRIVNSGRRARNWQHCYCHKLLGEGCRKAPVRLLRRASFFSQHPCNGPCGMTLQEASGLGVFSFWNPGKLPSVRARHSTRQFPTMCPIFPHYPCSTPSESGGGDRNRTALSRSSEPEPHERKSLSDPRFLSFLQYS